MKHRKLTIARSVLLALADRWMHGPVTRDSLPYVAQRANRCDDCGLTVKPGDFYVHGTRHHLQPHLFVHATCPRDDVLFRVIPWLSRWEGSDIVSAWFIATYEQRCVRCSRHISVGKPVAAVRRPGPLLPGRKHTDYVCEECVNQ